MPTLTYSLRLGIIVIPDAARLLGRLLGHSARLLQGRCRHMLLSRWHHPVIVESTLLKRHVHGTCTTIVRLVRDRMEVWLSKCTTSGTHLLLLLLLGVALSHHALMVDLHVSALLGRQHLGV